MTNKKFILNADDFGLSNYHNQAVLEGYNNGFLTGASICANGEAYENAIHNVLPDCPNLGIAVHLNIMEGKALTYCPLLTDDNKNFNKDFFYYMYHQSQVALLDQIEQEFRAQIEKATQDMNIERLDSHVHVHAIPEIFEITCKLAKEYGIKYVRTQFEQLYFVPNNQKHINLKYPLNLAKIFLLRYLTGLNQDTIKKYGIKTNNYVLGVGYTGMMDAQTIEYGLNALKDEDCIVEAIIHPCKYSNTKKDSHSEEFAITQDAKLKNTITRLGFDITNLKNVE